MNKKKTAKQEYEEGGPPHWRSQPKNSGAKKEIGGKKATKKSNSLFTSDRRLNRGEKRGKNRSEKYTGSVS